MGTYLITEPISVGTPAAGGPGSARSVAIPAGRTVTTSGAKFQGQMVPNDSALGNSSSVNNVTVSMANTSAAQAGLVFVQASPPLAAAAALLSSEPWAMGFSGLESDLRANAGLAVCVYVWRPSTSTVVGFVYDSATALGSEFSATAFSNPEFATVNSQHPVDALPGDLIVLECWWVATQTAPTGAYTVSLQTGYSDTSGRGLYLNTPDFMTFSGTAGPQVMAESMVALDTPAATSLLVAASSEALGALDQNAVAMMAIVSTADSMAALDAIAGGAIAHAPAFDRARFDSAAFDVALAIPTARTLRVAAETRTVRGAAETRTLRIAAETRTVRVAAETRTLRATP